MAANKLKEARAEVKAMSDEQVSIDLADRRARSVLLRTQAVTEKVDKNHEFGLNRKHIARLLTERRARQIAKAPKAVK